jgi:hypothetical protein
MKNVKPEALEKELLALQPYVPGVRFARVSGPATKTGQPTLGLYIHIVDYADWRPCELNFWLMKLACKLSPQNPFAPVRGRDPSGFLRHMGSRDPSGFLRHMGSQGFYNELATKGANVDVMAWLRQWREQAKVYQEQSKRYWLYR